MGGVIHPQGNSEGGRRGRRDGRTEEWRNGDMSVDTSVLIAVFQGSYSIYLLPVSYFDTQGVKYFAVRS